jgi:hypothetical protein
MKLGSFNTQLLVALVFLALSIYRFTGEEYIQAILFLVMALGFSSMGVIREGYLARFHKVLNVLSWVFVIVAALLFLYAIQVGAL